MKKYRCIFTFARGNTVISVNAHDADQAVSKALETVDSPDVRAVEIWDETGLVSVRVGVGLPKNAKPRGA